MVKVHSVGYCPASWLQLHYQDLQKVEKMIILEVVLFYSSCTQKIDKRTFKKVLNFMISGSFVVMLFSLTI